MASASASAGGAGGGGRAGRAAAQPLTAPGTTAEVTLSFLTHLFGEIVRRMLAGAQQGCQLEERLHEIGTRVGWRLFELLARREKPFKKETKLLSVLGFVAQNCWKFMFGHAAELLKGQDHDNEYMIRDNHLPLTRYISVPRSSGPVSCAAFVAGVVEGILCCAEFPGEATAHTLEDAQGATSTTVLIRFIPDVILRDRHLHG